jgi:hypothetical protein
MYCPMSVNDRKLAANKEKALGAFMAIAWVEHEHESNYSSR